MENEKTMIEVLIEKARAAQAIFENYNQEQVDRVVKAVGKVVFDNALVLSQEAVEETGYGNVESKVVKHQGATAGAWHYLHDKKSVGMIDWDPNTELGTFAKPLGVVCCLTPATNPTSTAAANGMNILKCRNAMIISPHPRAKKVSKHCVDMMRDTLAELGAPVDLIQIVEQPSMDTTKELMSKVDVVVATGGAAMIKSAYSSGKPSFGVGQGNVQVLVAEDYKDFDFIAKTIVNSRSYDNGMPCTGEQAIHFPKAEYDALVGAFLANGAALVPDEKLDDLTSFIFKENGMADPTHVGKSAPQIAEALGFEVPEGTRILIFNNRGVGPGHPLCREKLMPVVQLFPYEDYNQAVEDARTNLLWEGAGHTAVIYTNDRELATAAAERLPVGRIVVNQRGGAGSGSQGTNGLPPTMSLGCGSWGNNSISENLTYKHLMNFTMLAYPIEGARPAFDKIWEE